MALSSTEYQALLNRVAALEDAVNNIMTAFQKMVTLDQVTQLGLIRQTEVAQSTVRIVGLESRVATLESYHRT